MDDKGGWARRGSRGMGGAPNAISTRWNTRWTCQWRRNAWSTGAVFASGALRSSRVGASRCHDGWARDCIDTFTATMGKRPVSPHGGSVARAGPGSWDDITPSKGTASRHGMSTRQGLLWPHFKRLTLILRIIFDPVTTSSPLTDGARPTQCELIR